MLADDRPLNGSVEEVTLARRVIRDEVTGEPLPQQPDDAEVVLRVALAFPLDREPRTLSIRPPSPEGTAAASIGFVCYHNGLPVNDFRYLPAEATVDLDWSDPWYSKFRHANLRRQFDAPLSAFLYIEPYEVRQEIIVRPLDLRHWIEDLEVDDAVIPAAAQEQLKTRVAEFLAAKNPVTIDGRDASPRLDRIHFIERSLRSTGIVDPPRDLEAQSATLGVIFSYPIDSLPQEVSMKWELFSPKIQQVPAATSDEAGGLPSTISPQDPVLTWKNFLTNPQGTELLAIAAPKPRQLTVPLVSAVCGLALLFFLARGLRRWRTDRGAAGRALAFAAVVFVMGAATLPLARVAVPGPFAKPPAPDEGRAEELVQGLLHNVYRAFDHHDEKLIYRRLGQSISGELLEDVYLSTRKSMELKNQGGLRISVKQVEVEELEPIDSAADTSYRCRWQVAGRVGHWGHVHRRVNEHVAELTIAPQEGRWKITEMEVLDDRRVDPAQAARR